MGTMKAIYITKPEELKILEVPIPQIGPYDVLCKVVCAGLCGTDYSIYTGEASFVKSGAVKFNKTLGHEWSGVVKEVGEKVTEFKKGVKDTQDEVKKAVDTDTEEQKSENNENNE